MAQSAVSVRLHSDEIVVLESEASADGSFGADIQLDAITDGYHTLHVYGVGADNYDIDYYKNVAVITSYNQIGATEEVSLESSKQEITTSESTSTTKNAVSVEPPLFTINSHTPVSYAAQTLFKSPMSILGQSIGVSTERGRAPFSLGSVKATRSNLPTIVLGLSALIVAIVLWLIFRQRRTIRRDSNSRWV